MKGKILIALLALGATSAVLANGHVPVPVSEPNYFDGFVLGLGAGVQHQTGNIKQDGVDSFYLLNEHHLIAGDKIADINSNLKSDFGDTALNGELFVGYGQTFNSMYYAGLELYGRYAHAKPEASNSVHGVTSTFTFENPETQQFITAKGEAFGSTFVDVKSDWSWGGSLKLGYLITPKTMFYVLAGLEYTKFDAHVDNSIGTKLNLVTSGPLPDSWVTPGYSYSDSFSENKWAFVPGVGIETMLTDKLSLSAQYTYADYADFSHHDNHVVIQQSHYDGGTYVVPYYANSSSDSKVEPSRGLFSLRLAYRFNGI